ncbi:hypothetical protein SLS62_001766 [Diatrype stigma]|uniref:chitinase n=1 Tax=Diatrype stigma TaxID=117547 RepID=A0AAN9UV85_9PEZI
MSGTRGAGSPFINGVYYPSWRVYKQLPPSALQLDCVNRVYYAFVLVNEDGTLRFLDEYADCQISADGAKGCLTALANVKQQRNTPNNNNSKNIKALVSIGGGSGSKEFPALAAHRSRRTTLAKACRELVDRFGFDGIDLDWEHPQSDADGKNYVALLEALRAALPASAGYELTTALPVGEYVLRHIDLARAARSLDYLHLMCYDFNGAWTSVCGHQSKLFTQSSSGSGSLADVHPELRRSGQGAVAYVTARGVPARQIVLGVPAYARSFGGAHGPGQPFQSHGEMDYVDLPLEWVRNARIDRDAGAAFYVDESQGGKGFVTFDVPETVRRKAEYVKSQGLAGLFYWTGVGDMKGPDSLVRAGYEALNS